MVTGDRRDPPSELDTPAELAAVMEHARGAERAAVGGDHRAARAGGRRSPAPAPARPRDGRARRLPRG